MKFEEGFPEAAIGDSVILGQLLHNILTNIIENTRDSKMELQCRILSMLSNDKILLSFNFEFPKNEKLDLDTIRNVIFDSAEDVETLMNTLLKDNFEAKFYLMKPLINRLNGTVRIEAKELTLVLKIEIPFKNLNTSIVGKTQQKRMLELPDMKHYNLSNSKNLVNDHHFYWNSVPNPMPSESTVKEFTSPIIMKEKLTERIKIRMNMESNS